MAGNSMKLTGALILILVSILAIILTWELRLLSPLGGIFIVGMCFIGAILMWHDAAEPLLRVDTEHVKRTETER
ncbi:hypothetical protein A8709_22915 [Paenibacillus pectinilyticus]|uniref:Uncharacterized protein n=1 Tax=Paenibacillus pectinilyticus TaxID=512399 RepID=A0A1C0ZRP1_9BACL|nr:hypothetical protein A8709_22915 [Paenibacillus pectinilyticus]